MRSTREASSRGHGKRLTVLGVSNRLRNAAQRSATVRGFVRDVMPKLEDGSLRPLVDKVFAFMESATQVGKIVVRV